MSKDDAVAFLKAHGYTAYLDGGVVMVELDGTGEEFARKRKKVAKELRDHYYFASFGTRGSKERKTNG
ncbi:MAG: hypothetical protein Q4B26_02085 [Eubacteriales bacterium]|nr:hypothetical protein [Eubacteriales bacterium]